MKTVSTCLLFCLVLQIASAQNETLTTSLREMEIKGPAKEIIEYIYNGKLNETSVDTSKKPTKRIMDFDANGNKIAEIFLSSKGALVTKLTFDYHEKNKVTVREFDANNRLNEISVFNYDDNRQLLGRDGYNPQFETAIAIFKTAYKYDANGNRIEEDSYIGVNLLLKDLLFYDGKNRKEKVESYDMKGKLLSISKFKYDGHGDLASQEHDVNMAGMTDNTTSNYQKKDKYGNWLLQTSTQKGKNFLLGSTVTKTITKRSIKYF
jgi:hypothetical protein